MKRKLAVLLALSLSIASVPYAGGYAAETEQTAVVETAEESTEIEEAVAAATEEAAAEEEPEEVAAVEEAIAADTAEVAAPVEEETEEAELLPGEVEKDPTAYLFRRNVATHLSILGLRRNEIEYIMGHDIEDERDSRNFFRNEDKLYPIAIKMHERPVVNHLGARQVALEDDKRPLILNDVSRATIHIAPDPKAAYSLYIREHEPNGKLKVTFRSDDNESRASILGTYKASPFDSEYQDKATMLISYHERYEAARERVKKINQQQEKSDDNLHSKTSSTK